MVKMAGIVVLAAVVTVPLGLSIKVDEGLIVNTTSELANFTATGEFMGGV
jgi:hypothetical protein